MVKHYFQTPPTSLRALWKVKTRSVSDMEEKTRYQTWKGNLTRLSHRFGYQNLLHNVGTVCTVTPVIPAIIVDATAGTLAASAIPASISCINEIKIMEIYSDKPLEISQKNASLTWADGLFINQTPRLI
jgi:hypothetical protein